MRKVELIYATRSQFKRDEVERLVDIETIVSRYGTDVRINDHFSVVFADVETAEPLERDLFEMVKHKAISAYRKVLQPCIVEHAGLILENFVDLSYPGGLTQPMWDALGAERFLQSVARADSKVMARAVVGYCDGLDVRTFVGETWGEVAEEPRGGREFYWDTIFIPESGEGLTYAEMVEEEGGVERKLKLSQSAKALRKCLEHMLQTDPVIFPRI